MQYGDESGHKLEKESNEHGWPTLMRAVGIVTLLAIAGVVRAESPFEREPINYLTAEANDPVSQLRRRIASGETRLAYDEKFGYLPAVLKQLDIPISSQMLVFSKTSFQQKRISPRRPRALYFNDDVYVGWVQRGDVVELSAVDPQLGAVFYTLDQRSTDSPEVLRQTHQCLQCHASSMTEGVPGHLVRSVYPDSTGFPILAAGTFRISHESPFRQRWGGWYVTGTHGKQTHLGNLVFDEEEAAKEVTSAAGANVTDLSDHVEISQYISPHSDIVALMVLEHQTKMHNLITRTNFATRRALFDEQIMNRMLERPPEHRSESTLRRISNAGDELLRYMLLVKETPLAEKISGTSTFARDFASAGPQDAGGRSLRDLDLQDRLFKYPCSYLIYSPAFDGLPKPAKDHIYRRLWEVLTGQDQSDTFARLSKSDRTAIYEILSQTKPELPKYWRSKSQGDN